MRHVRDPENICAAVLIVAFFLPWATFLTTIAGYQLPQLGGGWIAFWSIPVLSIGVIVLGALEIDRLWLSVLTGFLPLAGLIYLLTEFGTVLFEILHIGGYLTVLAGIALIAAALGTRTKQQAAAGAAPEVPDAVVE